MSFTSKGRSVFKLTRIFPKVFVQADAETVRRKLVVPARKRARILLVKAFKLRLTIIDSILGPAAGNAAFWRGRSTHEWSNVDARLCQLLESYPEAIIDFTKRGYAIATNSEVLLNLARSALTRDALRDCLAAEKLHETSTVRHRIIRSQMTCAGFIAAATLLLSDKDSAVFAKKAADLSPPFSTFFRRRIDSCGRMIASNSKCNARRSLPHSGFKAPKKKRLIVVKSLTDNPTLLTLFQGAETATVFVIDDLYGRANFDGRLQHAGACQVDVEHCRTRITRFSSDYHRVHEDTRAVAEKLTQALGRELDKELVLNDPTGTAMALADNLFFPCLTFVALERLFASDEFDHIVIAVAGEKGAKPKENKSFINLLSGIKGITADPRVEMVCLAPNSQALQTMDVLLSMLHACSVPPAITRSNHQELSNAITVFKNRSKSLAQGFGDWHDTAFPRVLFATSQVAAYNRSSVRYIQSLSKISNVRVAFLGGNLLSFTNDTDDRISADMITPLPQRPDKSMHLLHLWLVKFLGNQLGSVTPAYVTHVMSNNLMDVARNGILSYIAHAQLCDEWFARLKDAGQLPKTVILTPFRSSRVAAFAVVARRYGVPSIAIEPHGLNASYCRYCKITADYYGVISHFFAQAAVEGFGMSLDRCAVVGSPRLQGPKDYDVVSRTAEVRARLKVENLIDLDQNVPVISYFTQPSDWSQISEVWRIILKATDGLDCKLVLKSHPEESSSRVNAYLEIARELGAMGRLRVVDIDAVSLIEASDLVLSGYSATVVEAALYRRTVFCVTNGKVNYPLKQHDVIGGPLFSSTTALRRAIKAFLKNKNCYQETTAAFFEREPQLLNGFEKHFSDFVNKVISMPAEEAMRPADEVPKSLFLDGPHTVYKI